MLGLSADARQCTDFMLGLFQNCKSVSNICMFGVLLFHGFWAMILPTSEVQVILFLFHATAVGGG